MSCYSDEVEQEREHLSGKFINFAVEVCKMIKSQNYWADLIDPTTGHPYLGQRGSTVLVETDDAVGAFGYEILDLGCCKVVHHREWKTHSFLSFIFSNAPQHVINSAIAHHQKLISSSSNKTNQT